MGLGAYAVVKKGIHKTTGKAYALKFYEKIKLLDIQKKNSVKREIAILASIDHPSLIKVYEVIDLPKQVIFKNKCKIVIVMDLVIGISLLNFLRTKKENRIGEKECSEIFYQIMSGVNYLHSINIYHRDIKLENIIINEENNKIKLIDYGFSICAESNKLLNFLCGTPTYMPPEIVQKKDYLGILFVIIMN